MLKVVEARHVPWEQVSSHRSGTIEFKRLERGCAGTPLSFELALVRFAGYSTPRHRHNYDQLRYQLLGDLPFAGRQVLPEGSLGYFPEGTPYGPQQVGTGVLTLALQVGGPSGVGFYDYDELGAASRALAESGGTFEGGIFRRRHDDGRQENVDGYDAVWQHLSGRPVEHSAPQYEAPVIVHPKAFRWRPVEGAPRIAQKSLGSFTDVGTSVTLLRVDAGAELAAPSCATPEILVVLHGSIDLDGVRAPALSTAFSEGDEPLQLKGVDSSEVLRITLGRHGDDLGREQSEDRAGFQALLNEPAPSAATA